MAFVSQGDRLFGKALVFRRFRRLKTGSRGEGRSETAGREDAGNGRKHGKPTQSGEPPEGHQEPRLRPVTRDRSAGKVILVGRPRQPLNQRADIVSFLTFHFGFCQVLRVFRQLASVLRVLLRTGLALQTNATGAGLPHRSGTASGKPVGERW